MILPSFSHDCLSPVTEQFVCGGLVQVIPATHYFSLELHQLGRAKVCRGPVLLNTFSLFNETVEGWAEKRKQL